MTINKILFLAISLFLFLTSCQKESLEEVVVHEECFALEGNTPDQSKESVEEIVERMRQRTVKFLEMTGQSTDILLKSTTSSNAYNSGRISVYYPSVPYSNYKTLNFGNGTGTTKWASLTLDNIALHTIPDGNTNNRSGELHFYLSAVNQPVVLDFSINVVTQSAVITPTTYAILQSRQVPSTSFPLGGPMTVTIHVTTAGWLWVEVKKSSTVVFSSLYRYSSGVSLNNTGNIRAFGFGAVGVGPRPPYSQAGITTNYRGYCGRF